MRLIEIKNVSKDRISVSQVRGFRLDPGESLKVSPATAMHPAVRRYLPPQGKSLELVTQGNTAEVEPIAPAKPPEVPVVAAAPVSVEVTAVDVAEEPVVVEEPAVTEVTDDSVMAEEPVEIAEPTEMAGTLREVFIEAPGVTESNIDVLVETFESISALSDATKDDLTALGFSGAAAKKLLAWSKNR